MQINGKRKDTNIPKKTPPKCAAWSIVVHRRINPRRSNAIIPHRPWSIGRWKEKWFVARRVHNSYRQLTDLAEKLIKGRKTMHKRESGESKHRNPMRAITAPDWKSEENFTENLTLNFIVDEQRLEKQHSLDWGVERRNSTTSISLLSTREHWLVTINRCFLFSPDDK